MSFSMLVFGLTALVELFDKFFLFQLIPISKHFL